MKNDPLNFIYAIHRKPAIKVAFDGDNRCYSHMLRHKRSQNAFLLKTVHVVDELDCESFNMNTKSFYDEITWKALTCQTFVRRASIKLIGNFHLSVKPF